MIFLYGPIIVIPVFSFNDSLYVSFPLKGFTTKWYHQLVNAGTLVDALRNSLLVGFSVSLTATVLGLFCSLGLTQYRMKGKSVISAIIVIPLVIPFIITGISTLILFKTIEVPLSLFTVGLAHLLLCIPFSVLVLSARLQGFDRHLFEAAYDLGDNWWMTFFRVTVPIVWPAIVSSLLLCFTISFDEFVITFFVSGNQVTLPLYIWGQLRFPQQLPSLLALSTCILLGTVALVIIAEILRRRGDGLEAMPTRDL